MFTKLKLIIITMLMLILLCSCGLSEGKLNIDSRNNIINKLIDQYNKKHGFVVNNEKIEIYKIKPYKEGYLVLFSYNEVEPQITLLNIQKIKGQWSIAQETVGQYSKDDIGVNSVETNEGLIYYGNIKPQKDKGTVYLKLDDGEEFSENIADNIKGYIIITESKSAVVDLILNSENNTPTYFIKDFINYGIGIFETKWN